MTGLNLISWSMVICEPVAAAMLAHLIVRYRVRFALRIWGVVLVVGLLMHAAQHVSFLFDMRQPRTLVWVFIHLSIVGAIATLWVIAMFSHRDGRLPRVARLDMERILWG